MEQAELLQLSWSSVAEEAELLQLSLELGAELASELMALSASGLSSESALELAEGRGLGLTMATAVLSKCLEQKTVTATTRFEYDLCVRLGVGWVVENPW